MNAYLSQQLQQQARVCIARMTASQWGKMGLDTERNVWAKLDTPIPDGALPDLTDCSAIEIDTTRPDQPCVRVTVGQGGDQVEVIISLYESGNTTDAGLPTYDSNISVSNGDWAGFDTMLASAQWATLIWDRLGLSDRFPIVGKDE